MVQFSTTGQDVFFFISSVKNCLKPLMRLQIQQGIIVKVCNFRVGWWLFVRFLEISSSSFFLFTSQSEMHWMLSCSLFPPPDITAPVCGMTLPSRDVCEHSSHNCPESFATITWRRCCFSFSKACMLLAF